MHRAYEFVSAYSAIVESFFSAVVGVHIAAAKTTDGDGDNGIGVGLDGGYRDVFKVNGAFASEY